LHEAGATNWTQPEHCCPLFGWSWYFAASWVNFVCVKRVCATALVETIAPAIIGTLFNSDRRQTPFLIELEGLVMRALLALPRNEASLARKNRLVSYKVPGTPAKSRATALLLIEAGDKRRGRFRLHRLCIGCLISNSASKCPASLGTFPFSVCCTEWFEKPTADGTANSEAAMSDRIGRDVSRPQLLHSGQTQQTSQRQQTAAETGVHPLVIKIAVGAAVWFVVTSWLAFAWDSEVDYLLVIVTLFFAIFFTLFLLTASFSVHDARWPVRHGATLIGLAWVIFG
jgi:hypothetical protein